MKTKWKDINIGDFFIADIRLDESTLLYQRIDENKSGGYNAVLLNKGELCCLYIRPDTESEFQKVEVSFEIKNID